MPSDIDLDNYVCGGYFLTKRIPRPPDVSNLAPNSLITLSDCFTDIAPDDWADGGYNYDDEERAQEALKFGIPSTVVPELVRIFTEASHLGYLSNSFPSLPVAQAFYRNCSDKDAVVLLGIGLERSLLPSLRAQLPDDVNRGLGLVEHIDANAPLERGGEVLGYEPIGYEATKFHSWLCHNALIEAYERFGLRTNS